MTNIYYSELYYSKIIVGRTSYSSNFLMQDLKAVFDY